MRRIVCLIALLAIAGPARAQGNLPPHAWLFGAWTGGLFPPPSQIGAQECLSMPVVIFTRDLVLRALITDQFYAQRLVETARVTGDGVEFRFANTEPAQAPAPFGLPSGAAGPIGFGCANPNLLRVQRHTENEISFPGCSDFPYPLVRCPAR